MNSQTVRINHNFHELEALVTSNSEVGGIQESVTYWWWAGAPARARSIKQNTASLLACNCRDMFLRAISPYMQCNNHVKVINIFGLCIYESQFNLSLSSHARIQSNQP